MSYLGYGRDINSGYVGASRSVRSQSALDNYEMPLSLISREVINEFIDDYMDEYPEYDTLRDFSVVRWKFIAKFVGASSWHHTSNYFNKTDHYSLVDIANKMIEKPEDCEAYYQELKRKAKKKREAPKGYEYGVITVQVWGGTRKRPKLEGHENIAGIIISDWLYYKHAIHSTIKRCNVTANKTTNVCRYRTYAEMVKKHQDLKGTVKLFNSIIKEKI